ncbi:uncharacterized protein MYCGRDRAFT_103509 [Zymoseptoria tritici IPO323]|uniref:Uncharacterized protein n=1 Tax=Zymoseptoria tritici (strain CBS 115943 / IPO323) TaxID=336722 RepID=F9X4X6_ZYMTI|nr:uncharacterized protein MYCGRDRAFT_103509 [Zymoseptoria tritici IPO323]EGP90186.1 hypothetical protein MYCGRDRAFT_103509 [Zymoseptoria tritici IPO323]
MPLLPADMVRDYVPAASTRRVKENETDPDTDAAKMESLRNCLVAMQSRAAKPIQCTPMKNRGGTSKSGGSGSRSLDAHGDALLFNTTPYPIGHPNSACIHGDMDRGYTGDPSCTM